MAERRKLPMLRWNVSCPPQSTPRADSCAPRCSPPFRRSPRRDSRPALKGSLSVEKGVRVLRLHGTPHEMGYAHGFLLAAEIVEGFESYVVFSPVVGGPKNYEARIVPKVRREMVFLPEHEAELAGMLEGITAALGDKRARARARSADRADRPEGPQHLRRLVPVRVLELLGVGQADARRRDDHRPQLRLLPDAHPREGAAPHRVRARRPRAQALGQRRRSRACSA